MTLPDDATIAQIRAADPGGCTWLSANAGSGKTRVLTNRVARLLLRQVNPQSILCLTYTKAAASEMQNRLFQTLGQWAMLDDHSLERRLRELGEKGGLDLPAARRLFASAVETPGGLKIQTIHSFCASLLRRFPLEAGVSPRFREMDDRTSTALIREVLDDLATEGTPSLGELARHYGGDGLASLSAKVIGAADAFQETGRQEVYARFGLSALDSPITIWGSLFDGSEHEWWDDVIAALGRLSSTYRQVGSGLAGVNRNAPVPADIAFLKSTFLYKTGERRNKAKLGGFPQSNHTAARAVLQPWMDSLEDLMLRVEACNDRELGLAAAEKTWALHMFASDLLPAYAAAKSARGFLDFDDLILRARALLTAQSLQWVLYRLDGGIDHILVDEAQDTSPEQWAVIRALCAEISAGQGAGGDRPRTVFFVGDKKQSIYSFQGADARAFDEMADAFEIELADGPGLRRLPLVHSFRSSSAILDAVDAVFQGDMARGLGDDIRHKAFYDDLRGRVDLWPLEPRPDKPENKEWTDPLDFVAADSPIAKLAERIAENISGLLENGSIPGKDGHFRPVRAGDILILVQGRGPLFDRIIRACKKAGLPMAGSDRLKVNAELAVRDLLALLAFLALPEDDLSLAVVLRSPLFGWSEERLYRLARARLDAKDRYLWETLRQSDETGTIARLSGLRDLADFLRPFELLEHVLTRQSGRQALTSRLGSEAEDGIDELLSQALAYEDADVPSLTGFLAYAQAGESDIRRQVESGGNQIRVMTVHGAKGLESEIVILPDTVKGGSNRSDPFLAGDDGQALWNVGKDEAPAPVAAAKAADAAVGEEERNRLLYVAMTRARTWLIVCGIEQDKTPAVDWHSPVQSGLERAGAVWIGEGRERVLRLEKGPWEHALRAASDVGPARPVVDISAFLAPAPRVEPDPGPVSPSDLGGPKALPGDAGDGDVEAAMLRGTRIHALLEHLPGIARDAWPRVASRLTGMPDGEARSLLDEATAAIDAFPEVFDPQSLAEVDISAHLAALDREMLGTIDRLIVSETGIHAIDFKTNALIPASPDTVPVGVLRQMGAYLEALEAIWPDRAVRLSVLWTTGPLLMEVPHAIVRQALADATIS